MERNSPCLYENSGSSSHKGRPLHMTRLWKSRQEHLHRPGHHGLIVFRICNVEHETRPGSVVAQLRGHAAIAACGSNRDEGEYRRIGSVVMG